MKLTTLSFVASLAVFLVIGPVYGAGLGDELFELTASDAARGDRFGFSVAISGNTAIVGAPFNDDAPGGSSGSAYLFDVTTANENELFKLTASDAAAGDEFGFSVAMSGDRAIIGTPDGDDTDGGDLDGGGVGGSDLQLILENWGKNVPPGDARADPSGDAFVGGADLQFVLNAWGEPANTGSAYLFSTSLGSQEPSPSAVPEPSTMLLLAIAAVFMPLWRSHHPRRCREDAVL